MNSEPLEKSFATVAGKRMAYHEAGAGDTVLFLHGNPDVVVPLAQHHSAPV